MSRPSKRNNQPELIDDHGGHLTDYQIMQKRRTYCAIKGKENKSFAICLACNIPLCLAKERDIKFSSTYNIYFIYFR